MITQMNGGYHDLAAASRIGPSIARIVKEDYGSIGGLDDALEIGFICAIASSPRMVGASELPLDLPFTSALGQIEVLTFGTGSRRQGHFPPMGISEADTI
jgi:hypothetical protein